MALPQGINFRATSGYVTDPTGITNEVSRVVNYPRTTPQGNNVGWETLVGTLDTRNRTTSVDPRLAGVEFLNAGAGNSAVYRIDLPSSGSYNIRAAFGDIFFSVVIEAVLQDGDTDVATLISYKGTGAAGNFYDATDTLRTGESDWVNNNAALTQSFSTSILRVRIPGTSGAAKSIAHFYVEAAGGGAIELTASNNSQTDTSATGVINQSHALTSAACAQADSSSNDAITQIHIISSENGTQSDVSATSAITQQHILVAGASDQTDTAATGQISQAHELTVTGSAQTDASGTGVIGVGGISLAASSCEQTDASSAGSLTQAHALSAANSVQTDASSTGAITSAGDLAAANCSQTDTSATGAITQTHSITAENSTQTDISGTGAIDVGSVINLTAANSAQTDSCQTAIITQTHLLIAAPSVQDDVAAASAIVQQHILAGANSMQQDVCSTGSINSYAVVDAPSGPGYRPASVRVSRPSDNPRTRPGSY